MGTTIGPSQIDRVVFTHPVHGARSNVVATTTIPFLGRVDSAGHGRRGAGAPRFGGGRGWGPAREAVAQRYGVVRRSGPLAHQARRVRARAPSTPDRVVGPAGGLLLRRPAAVRAGCRCRRVEVRG